jgi:antitoxin component YwqK of YwqJK toxin-antitoxin module
MGKQCGEWMQVFEAGQGNLFSGELDEEFSGPFVSKAIFVDGQLHGTWTIVSGTGDKIIEWSFLRGLRHGVATWWYPNGVKRHVLTYEYGEPVGESEQFSPDGELIGTTRYIDGRPLVKKEDYYSGTQKQYEGTVLAAQELGQPEFDWWNNTAKPASDPVKVPELKHGMWTEWYPNGRKKAEGGYDQGLPHGKFVWWYENGQRQAAGGYENGLRSGTWVTWHPNGMKESIGEYSSGELTGKWMRWEASGRLVEMRHMADSTGGNVHQEEGVEEDTQQQANAYSSEIDELEASQDDEMSSEYWADDALFE